MAKECLKMYFMKQPPANQYLCRAYLCQAQLLAPLTAGSPDQLEKAVVYLIKAISMAKENPRYHFLVYNASVLYWQFSRPFLKPNFRQYLARSLHQVVKALDDIDDKDYEWRAQLMLALIECHKDAGRKQDATHIAQAAASFIKQNVPALYKTVFGYMVRYQLSDVQSQKMQKDIRTSADLNVYYRICRLKLAIEEHDAEKDVVKEMRKILLLLQGHEEPKIDNVKGSKGGGGRRSTTPDEKRSTTRSNTSLNLSGRFSPVPPPARKLTANSEDRPHLLLELGRLALEQNVIEVAQSCLDLIKDNIHLIQDSGFLLEVEFLQCELMVKSLGDKQESYQKSVVEIRQQAIKRCDEAILNAIRSGNPGAIQAGCVTQWNLCLPLLQPNLRKHVRRPLTQVAEALENIQSLLIQLRCQVHTEVAKCEEDQEQIEVAIKHLHKAQALDDGAVYKDRLDVALHRLELRATLYSTPERPEDQAAMIIEQARKANSGTMRMKRSLLVRAGEALAPDAFLLVLESESDTKEVTSGKGLTTVIAKLAGKAHQFNKCVKKAMGHLKRLGDESDKERAQLWGDLAKTARKQEVWDVCRVAARFCLLYDDGRWKNEPPKAIVPSRQDRGRDPAASQSHVTIDNRAETIKDKSSTGDRGSRPTTPEPTVPLHEKDLIRMLTEVHFINGEALIHLLRSEGVELGDEPIPPVDKSKRPKGYIAKKPEEDEDWIEYRAWIHSLTQDAVDSFLRGSNLGVDLEEPWVVCSAAAYLWNYYNHVLQQNRHKEIVETFQTLLDAFKKVGHAGETIMLTNICNAIAVGLMQPWIPETPKEALVPSPPPANKSPRGSPSRRAQMLSKPSKAVIPVTVNPDATPDLKKGLEVCEYIIKVTNGDVKSDVVPIATRMQVLQTWVRTKQMLQAQISRAMGVDDESSTEGQIPMTRAIVAVEMLSLNYNGIMEFKEIPTYQNAANMIENCQWTDSLIELQIWTKLAYLAFDVKQHEVVARSATKALEIGEMKSRKIDGHLYMVEQEMLSYASVIYGQSLMENAQGNNAMRRQAIEHFLNSARFGSEAQNAELVVTAGRHYWNAILPLISQPIERELLREPISILLECINDTTDRRMYDRKHEDSDDDADVSDGIKPVDSTGAATKEDGGQGSAPAMGTIGGPDDDLTLRASLYGVLFQSYADKGQWEQGLMAMDQAVKDMPRTNHRLLIFKHMVMTKAKLGQSVQMSIQKFKDGSEDYVAHMWRKVALCSTEQLEQLQAYQNAIETLVSEETQWQKFEYLLEFAQWLYCNEFPIRDALDQLQWAVDILLSMQKEEEKHVKQQAVGGTKKRNKPKKEKGKSPSPPTKPAKKPSKTWKSGSKTSKDDKNKAEKAKLREPSPEKKQEKSVDASSESGEVNAADYIPVQKEIIIGLLPGNPDLKIDDLTDVRQLEGLFRSHVMLAQLAGQGAVQFSHYCFMAYRFIMAMWRVSLRQTGPVIKEIAKQPPPEPTKGSAKGKSKKEKEVVKEKPKRKTPLDHVPSSTEEWAVYDAPEEALEAFRHKMMKTTGINSNNISKPMLTIIFLEKLVTYLREMGYAHMALPVLAFADVIARDILKNEPLTTLIHLRAVEVVKEKPKRKTPLDHVPSSTEEWAVYDAPEEALEAFRHKMMKTTGINSNNISKPMLTIIFLEKLVTYLREMGYAHMALPVLAFADVIARDILKNEPLTTLIHLRAVEVCLELNLADGVTFHEKLAIFRINEDQQARSREEMTAWAEKQLQVAREERRLRETMTKFNVTGKTGSAQKLTAKRKPKETNANGNERNLPVVEHLGRIVGSVSLRDVWTDAAQLLMQQGLYQPAREMLREAHLASESFSDPALTARILYLLGGLSYIEAQYKQAVNFCSEAQKTFDGDEMFWYETTMLMIDATLKDYTLKGRYRLARGMLVHAVNIFLDIAEKRPNKASITGYILAMLEAKLGNVQIMITKEEHDDVTKPKVINGVLSALKKVRNGYHRLVRLGYNREALPLYKKHADILCNMARAAHTASEKHEFYIQALEVYTEACNLSDLIYHDVTTTSTLHDLRNVSLPCQRECAEIHNLSVDLQLEILDLHIQEERNIQLRNIRKSSVLRAVEEMTRETPVYTDTEQRWVDTVKLVAENASVELAAVHNMTGLLPNLKSQALYLTGRCLRLTSQHNNPDQPMQWELQNMCLIPMKDHSDPEKDKQEEDKAEQVEGPSRPQSSKYTQFMQKLQAQLNNSHSYLAEATECLQQALNLALNNNNKETAGLAALELAECIGQYDLGLTSQYLALYQSCMASQYLEKLMHSALVDPTTSQQAALFHQQKALLENDITTNASHGSTLKGIHEVLNENSVAWQRLMISPSHLDLLKDLPANFNIVLLQHNSNRSCLYGAVLDKPKNIPAAKPGKGAAQQTISKARVVRAEKDPKELDNLLSRYKWFKHDVMQMLLKQEYQRSQHAQREKMLANLDDASKPADVGNEAGSNVSDEEKLEEEFKSLLHAMEQYLEPITFQLDHIFRPSSASTTGNPKRGADKEKEGSQEYLVLLADHHLMQLPLEALNVLQTENLTSVSRDVSLQILFNKVHQQILDEAAEKAKKEKEKTKPPSRIPGLRDASKKMSKIIPLDRPVPAGSLPLDTHTFRFVVDPNLDCSETETKAPIDCFNKMLEEHEQQFTPRWLGVTGDDHVPSIGEYETYINESSGFVFYGMERFLSYLPPFKIAALNLVDSCQLMMLLDLAQTNSSFLRQSKVDVFKTAEAQRLEKPVETALLLGLTGVRSVCLNQWHCTLSENAERLDVTMKDLLAGGQTIGQTIRLLFTPYRRPKPEPEGEDDKQSGSDKSKQAADDTADQSKGEEESTNINRSWYNMVCYGAPNLMVTQLSKP